MIAHSAVFDSAPANLPSDAGRMIARWERLGRPAIELQPGVLVSNLERWLLNNTSASAASLGRIREYLYVDTFGINTKVA